MSSIKLNIEELSWEKVRDSVQKSNPMLADIFDKFDSKHSFIKARYRYGNTILHKGELHLPTQDGFTVPLSANMVPKQIQKQLGYRSVPMSIILSRSVEVSFETDERVMPSKFWKPGTVFGLWELFDPEPNSFVRNIWSLFVGARLAFMLPKIGDAVAHARLKKEYGVTAAPPKTLLEQHKVFAELARQTDWDCEILFVSGEWIEEQNNNIASLRMYKHLLQEAWKQSYNCREQMDYSIERERFSKIINHKRWKMSPYMMSTIQHLSRMGLGIFPGFVPVGLSEIALPTKAIQDAYIQAYQLKQYAPIIMVPHHLSDPETPIYYSLSLPTLLEYAPQATTANIISEIRELKMLIEMLEECTKEKSVHYEFFHSEEDQLSEITKSERMPEEDKNLLIYPKEYGERLFPGNSPFLRGCIRISRKP